ncbi:MAG: molybdopterin synthase sulfur carrier subunit, partial [Sandarakinorhabdus sp.]|nr:molybdopterin synthase sulfur carrier subunit [Sandarakinorhabdus sp.]
MTMQILYFAWVRERTGIAGESIGPPAEITSVRGLLGW